MKLRPALLVFFLLAAPGLCAGQDPLLKQAPPEHELIQLLAGELEYSAGALVTDEGTRPYYLAYTVTDNSSVSVQARFGALQTDRATRSRVLDVDVRVGDYGLDSSHELRGSARGGGFRRGAAGAKRIALENHPAAIRHAAWQATDRAFKDAVETYQQVLTNVQTMVEEESADDFSREDPSVRTEPEAVLEIDRKEWVRRVRAVSAMALAHPLIYSSDVSLVGGATNKYMVTSEQTRIVTGQKLLRVALSASTRAEDGMELSQTQIFNASTEEGLPSEEAMSAAFKEVIDMVLALREAPLVDPYTGPAILLNRASGVFFHEIFGHRIEGHRQKSVDEGQTFTRMIDMQILPAFLNVVDDPTLQRFGGEDLRGFYRYDDEGVAASRVELVKDGVLKTFLLSRSPVLQFNHSNGHGRREPGNDVVSRQGNLMISSSTAVSYRKLREMLVDECEKQNKPYGFLFADITGGFTSTSRGGPQAFKVLPVVVYRIFADGRPDELVRGVDIVGTPLSCFSKIVCTGDDPAVFNGSCGAESGWVPVSAVSPSLLVEQIEIEKRQRSQERLPILTPPIGE
ncbi:MAG: metallopeptidase TldD-related protein [Planctomycetota bacterium]